MNIIPPMTSPMARHWQQPADIREVPMDDTHVLLTVRQVRNLPEYNTTFPSGTYYGKCWLRVNNDTMWLCWYHAHPDPKKIGIGSRLVLVVV